MFASKRLSKELIKIKEQLPPGISLHKADDLQNWEMDIQVLDDNPLYRGETYRLRFTFSSKYPIEPPEVQFITDSQSQPQPTRSSAPSSTASQHPPLNAEQQTSTAAVKRPIPIHPHIYSNGIICLDLLSSAGWSPVQGVESVCMSIQSMLTANTRNERPPGDSEFVSYNRRRPRDINFMYDDDNV
ncbi:putative ubiquitin conjugating enzyme [Aspergillus tetrazonus]